MKVPGNKQTKVTALQVARSAGVSMSAVSRAFTPGASVSPATLQKVMTAAVALGYQPNALARSLMTGRTALIGLVSNNFDNPAFMEIFDLFTQRLQDKGLRPLLVNMSGNSDPANAVAMLRQYSVDGVIVASSTVSMAFIEGCVAAGIPIVHAFGKSGTSPSVQTVSADNIQGGQLAADVMCAHGYRKLAFLGGPQSASSTTDRLHGFRQALHQSGATLAATVYARNYSHAEGQRLMHHLLAADEIDAVFCGDDILAMGALDACKAHGRNVPGEIGVLGFNDIAMAAWPAFSLSTIRQPIADIIVAAVELSIGLVSDHQPPRPPSLFTCTPVLRNTLRKI